MSGANGHVTAEAERSHYCGRCGRWLFATSVPLGTSGQVRVQCTEGSCSLMNMIDIGSEPISRARRDAARDGWLAEIEMQRRRRRATRF